MISIGFYYLVSKFWWQWTLTPVDRSKKQKEIQCWLAVHGVLNKFRRIGVPTQDSFSCGVVKVCNLSRVEARYWKPKIVFSCSTNTSPVRTRSNICKSRILKIRFKYNLSQVITPNSARYLYPNNSWIPSFFWVSKRGRVIRRNLVLNNLSFCENKGIFYSFLWVNCQAKLALLFKKGNQSMQYLLYVTEFQSA